MRHLHTAPTANAASPYALAAPSLFVLVVAFIALLGGCSGGDFDLGAEEDDGGGAGLEVGRPPLGSHADASGADGAGGEDTGHATDTAADAIMSPDVAPSADSELSADTSTTVDTSPTFTTIFPADSDTKLYPSMGLWAESNYISGFRSLGSVMTHASGTFEVENKVTCGTIEITIYVNGYPTVAKWSVTSASPNSLPVSITFAPMSSISLRYDVTKETALGCGSVVPKIGVSKLTFW